MWCIERITGPAIAWSKTSRLAMNRTSRLEGCAASPPRMKSMYETWLNASSAPPEVGTCSVPLIWKRRPSTRKSTLAVAMTGG